MKIIEVNQDFEITLLQAEFAYNNMARCSIKFPHTLKGINFVEISNKKYKATADKTK